MQKTADKKEAQDVGSFGRGKISVNKKHDERQAIHDKPVGALAMMFLPLTDPRKLDKVRK